MKNLIDWAMFVKYIYDVYDVMDAVGKALKLAFVG